MWISFTNDINANINTLGTTFTQIGGLNPYYDWSLANNVFVIIVLHTARFFFPCFMFSKSHIPHKQDVFAY